MRRDIFSKYDEGVAIDREGLFSAKPEAAALEIAERLRGATVLDAFCGVGGSAIAFARRGKRVTTCDTSPERLAMARHNARLYGVEDRIDFIECDASEMLARRGPGFDAVYLDPPWGGPDYRKAERFHLSMFSPDGGSLLDQVAHRDVSVALTLPRNADLNDIAARRMSFFCLWSFAEGRPLFLTVFLHTDRPV